VSLIRVLHVGLGPIGASVLKQVASRRGFQIVGAVDVDSKKVGRDIGEVCQVGRRLRLNVSDDLALTLKATKPQVAVLCTSSSLVAVMPQIETILRSKTAIVSTTEELSYPTRATRHLATRIDACAKRGRVAVVGTGVNPGYAMDALPIALTGACERVDSVVVNRVQDARIRRLPFQQKIGAGLTEAQFRREVAAGRVRHVGLTQSIEMIADAVGWRLDRITDIVEPRLAASAVASEFLAVDAGSVAGLVQDGVGYRKGEPLTRPHMEAYFGAPETYDSVDIEGSPRLSMRIDGGIHGDIATMAIVVNSIPHVIAAAPGLHTMRDLPLPSFFPGRVATAFQATKSMKRSTKR
jgi:4-hydroxy-tetrahydrodipicolinate reductase